MEIDSHFGIDAIILTTSPEDDNRDGSLVIDVEQARLLVAALQAEIEYHDGMTYGLFQWCEGNGMHHGPNGPSSNANNIIPTHVPKEYAKHTCKHCNARVKAVEMGVEEGQVKMHFECGRIASDSPFTGKVEHAPCK